MHGLGHDLSVGSALYRSRPTSHSGGLQWVLDDLSDLSVDGYIVIYLSDLLTVLSCLPATYGTRLLFLPPMLLFVWFLSRGLSLLVIVRPGVSSLGRIR